VAFASRIRIERLGLVPGATVRLSAEEFAEATAAFPERRGLPGGSGPNTGSWLRTVGYRVALVGQIGNDQTGRMLSGCYRDAGLELLLVASGTKRPTTRSLILVGPDGEAATAICIGATADLQPSHLEAAILPQSTRLLFIEGRIIEQVGVDAMAGLFRDASAAGAQTACSIAGRPEVRRYRRDFLDTILPACDIVIGNEGEYQELLGDEVTDSAIGQLAGERATIVVTRGGNGLTALGPSGYCRSPSLAVPRIIDTTGAGDAFAAGFVHGFLNGDGLKACVDLGSTFAAHCVQNLGSWHCACSDVVSSECKSADRLLKQ
jgi:sugar/nucleoside kinase (ribokinase family)